MELYASKAEAVCKHWKQKAARRRQEIYPDLPKNVDKGKEAESTSLVTKRIVSQRNEWSGVIRDTVSFSVSRDVSGLNDSMRNILPAGYYDDDEGNSGYMSGEEVEEKPHWMKKMKKVDPWTRRKSWKA